MSRALIRRALEALGIRRFVLAIHDASFPAHPDDDLGRGAPLSKGARRFVEWAAEHGFDGLQLGPQGETTEHDASPYDATLFSRSTLSIAPGALVEQGLVRAQSLRKAVSERPPGSELKAAHRHVFAAQRALLDEAFARHDRNDSALLRFAAENAAWLDLSALYAALSAEHGTADWLRWPEADRAPPDPRRSAELLARHADLVARIQLEQWLAHAQHAAFHEHAARLGLRLYGDLQIGISHRDVWAFHHLFMPGLRMGAPPSRTNPDGQPWSYAVLDAGRAGVLDFVRLRVGKMLAELDGLRIDHPHGLIDPWVYEAAQPDGLRAVQAGTRLHSSPGRLPQHAIARADQLDQSQPRYADGWVRTLDDAQVDGYARLFDTLIAAARANGRDTSDLVCEVLSTQPYPVARVLQRHGLGRFRVTQKVGLDDPRDVYRSENAQPEDWIMVGNHDTDPLRRVLAKWHEKGTVEAHAAYLAERLEPDPSKRSAFAAKLSANRDALAEAKLAELFRGPARNVMIFFADLFGLDEPYNRPGVVSEENWSLRVPPDYAQRAVDLRGPLALAMRAQGPAFAARHAQLLAELSAPRA